MTYAFLTEGESHVGNFWVSSSVDVDGQEWTMATDTWS